MIILDCEQYSEEWWQARLGIPTASVFSQIISSTGTKSSSWYPLLYKLAAEAFTGKVEESFRSKWMERGHEIEPIAIAEYEFIKDVKVTPVGLCYRDDRKNVGFSPDGLVGDDGGVEAKSPSPGVQVKRLVKQWLPTEYAPQVYGSLYLSGRKWWDFVSYHPDFSIFIYRTTTEDEKYQIYKKALDKYLPLFLSDLNHASRELRKIHE